MDNCFGFKSWRYSSEHFYSDSGDPIKIVYSGYYDDDGILVLEEIGRENLYEYIQSFRESVDINNILARYRNGDTDALQRVQGIYMDATSVPKNMADLLNKLNKAENEFNNLPVEIKQMYGNDFTQFICRFDVTDLMQKPVEKVIEEKEVKDGQEH